MNGTLPRRVTVRPLKGRKYAHFDDPLKPEDLKVFMIEGDDVATRAFFPLLGYQKVTRKIDFSVFPPLANSKKRDIRYASHRDSAIYSVYAQELSAKYENVILSASLGSCVLAYRGGIGYNVPFAKSLIDEIVDRKSCHVVCLDVSGFFDHLDHKILKDRLKFILATDELAKDWYNIFRRVTAFEYVLREEIEAKIGKIEGGRICQIDTFRRVVRPLIKKNPNKYGIPQGTPLSGLLANIYMYEFDLSIKKYLEGLGGSYRRYSDDIAVVLPAAELEPAAIAFMESALSAHGLAFNAKKTCKTTFYNSAAGLAYGGDELQYLGFTFDGRKILIRPESIKNFYAKMKGNIRRYIKAASKKGIPLKDLRKRVLIGRFTHWGDSRNFVQYAYRASKELCAPEIKRQLRNHVPIFDRQWAKMLAKYGP